MPCNSDAAAAAGIPRSAARVPPHGRKRSKHPKTIRTMNYVELNIAASGEEAEILTALLADWPFESFSEEGGALRAYIPQEKLADCKSEVDALLDARGALRRTYLTIDDCNWNAAWESDFQPVDIDGRLLIRAPFHAPAADAAAEVVIMPRMSFGTGHHATTYLMTEALLELDLRGRRGLDAGSGTGVLAIAAAFRRGGRCRGHRRVGRSQLPRECRSERRGGPRAAAARRRGMRLGRALRLHSGQHQPQHPHGLHAPLRRDARAGRRPAAERLPRPRRTDGARGRRGRGRAARACGPPRGLDGTPLPARGVKSYKGRGIVLHTLKYGDSSLIVHLLTDTGGRRSYMVQGVRSTRGRGSKAALFQPMFAVEFEGLESPRMQMDRFREVRSGLVFRTLPFDVRKSTVALFMAEVLYRLVKESERNEALFDFVWGSVEALDALDEGTANFHLWFLAQLSRLLGFAPGNDYAEGDWFDVREGRYTPRPPRQPPCLTQEEARTLAQLLGCDVRALGALSLDRRRRVEFLDAMLAYYGYHLDAMGAVQSLHVLREVF